MLVAAFVILDLFYESARVLIASAEDGLLLISVLQNTMASIGHDGPSLPFDVRLPFQNKIFLIN